MKYTNQFGESVQIAASDEIWLNDEFFAREMAKLPPDAPRAGLAYRVSTKGQVDHDDIPMQKIECRKFCAQHGWRVVLEKAEKGVSGSKVSGLLGICPCPPSHPVPDRDSSRWFRQNRKRH